ncbi:MAG: tetratricopeptide repeat protein [Acidobacteriota bacterium]
MADAQAVLLTKSTRPIFFAGRNDVKISPPPSLRPWGWTYRLVRDDSDQAEAPAVSTRRNLRNMATADLDTDDLMARGLIANALLMDAEVAAERRDLDAARLLYRDAARYARGSKETLNNVGSTLAGRGFVTEAEELFRAAADDYPGYVTPRRNLANLLRDQGRPAEAEPLLEEIQELIVRGDLSAMEAAARIAPVSEARPSFGECAAKVKERPEDPSAWNNLGSAHAERGEMDEAKVAFEKALALDPSNPTPYRNLSLLYEKMNDPVRARTYQGMYESRKTAR